MSRPQSSASASRPRPPLESLIHATIPSLAPPSRRTASDGRPASGRTSTASISRPLSRAEEDDERARRYKVEELLGRCEQIMGQRPSASTPADSRGLVAQTSRILLSSARDSRTGGAERAMRFEGLWNRIERGRVLADPAKHLQFLLALSDVHEAKILPRPTSASSRSMLPPPIPLAPAAAPAAAAASSSRRPLVELPTPNVEPTPGSETWSGAGKSKAELLKDWRTSRSQAPFPDKLLLRDCLYLLQGIDGRYVKFALAPPPEQNPYLTDKGRAGEGTGFPLGSEGYLPPSGEEEEVVGIDIVVDEPRQGYISKPTRTLLANLSEMGMMYRRVTSFVQSHQTVESRGGMTEQSLCHFLHHELSEYHRLLAVLESQMSLNAPERPGESSKGNDSTLTLLRLGLWTEDMRLKLKLMSATVDDAKRYHGGALVSHIHATTSHGDPLVRDFMDQVLSEVSKPFFSTLQRWIFSGELHDPYKEFFVQLNTDSSLRLGRESPYNPEDQGFEGGFDSGDGQDEAGRVWEKKYVFVKGMIPGFVSEEFAKKIFSTGRSLNFIRYSCHDSDWIETQVKLANAGDALKYSDLAGLERSIDDAYSIASQRLLEIFFDKFNLLDHLKALKAYLMLGAGDFAEHLMEALAPRLSKPAISLYRHHLTSDLETAIRSSNAQFDPPDVLRRLDARVLEYSHGEIGWDCFALEYRVEAPLNAILDTKAMVEYDRLFHHLWRLKRVEAALTQGWMRITSGSRLFEHIPGLTNDWHHCRVVQAEMVHFLRQLQAFCQLEVIECSWQTLMDFTSKREGDLDALIQAHRTYLDRVVKKVLLLGAKREKQEVLLDLVREALSAILAFRDATDDLYSWCLGEATRLDRLRDTERGLAPPVVPDDPGRAQEHLRAIRERTRKCSIDFQDRVVGLCALAAGHADLDVRFLAIRLAFNGHYALRRSKSKSASTRQQQH